MCAICDNNVQNEYILGPLKIRFLNISFICKYGPLLPTGGPEVAGIEETVVLALPSIGKKILCNRMIF